MKTSFWKRLSQSLNDAVPVERETEILTDHDYDGIKELDNNLPPWWLYGFYLTIVVAVAYMVHYHVLGTGLNSAQEYQAEVAAAELFKQERLATAGATVDETNVTLVTDSEILSKAQAVFVERCAPCHLVSGGGSVGPNLTDEYWIHGGSIKDVFRTIKYGVTEKGMIPWQGVLTPEEMQAVASYILSLQGTNPEGGLPPQGEKHVQEQEEEQEAGAGEEQAQGQEQEQEQAKEQKSEQ